MKPEQLTALQWHAETVGVRRQLGEALKAACEASSVVCEREVKTTRVQPADRIPSRLTGAKDWPACYVINGSPYAYTPEPYTVETVTHHVAPSAFAAWLHAQGQEPSEHVANWFKAKGVAWPPVAADSAQADASPFPLADWTALVAYRKTHRGGDWGLNNQRDIAKAELQRRKDTGLGKSAALEGMARDLGTSRANLGKVMERERKREPKAKPRPVGNVTRVRDGQKQSRAA